MVLNFERKMHICEATLSAKSLKFSAKASSHDMYQSIDVALQRLEKQVHKLKDKRSDHHRAVGSRGIGSVIHGVITNPLELEGVKVLRSKKYAVKPMTVDEAVLQLAASRMNLVFSNAETDRTSVVYKRKDDHIGLIEPEY